LIGSLPFILLVAILIAYAWVRAKGKGVKEFIETSVLLLTIALPTYLLWEGLLVEQVGTMIQGSLLTFSSFILSSFSIAVCWWIITKARWKAKAEKDLADAVNQAQAAAKSLIGSAGQLQVATSKIEQFKKDFEQSMRDFKREIMTEVTDDLNKVRAEIPPAAPEISEKEINKIAGSISALLANAIPKRGLDDDEISRIAEHLGASIKGSTLQREGLNFQQVSAQILEVLGFEVRNSIGRDQPDHLLYAGGKLVAVGSAKSYTIKTSWTMNEERAGEREVSVARKKGLPLFINILNKSNGRIWLSVIDPRELENLTVTAPSWLWKEQLSAGDETEMKKNHLEAGKQLARILPRVARGRSG
jgi:hypothetical protein